MTRTINPLPADPDFVAKFDAILARGLSIGLGDRDGTMCIEAALCAALGEPYHHDHPPRVAHSVRGFKIRLNDSSQWVSPQTRALGLRNLGLAQVGSAGVVDDGEFARRVVERTIRVLIPDLFRRFPDRDMLAAATRCEAEGTTGAAASAASAASAAAKVAAFAAASAYAYATAATAATAASAAADHATADYAASAATAYAAAAADYADAAAAAHDATVTAEYYLRLSAQLALDILTELHSPGVALIARP